MHPSAPRTRMRALARMELDPFARTTRTVAAVATHSHLVGEVGARTDNEAPRPLVLALLRGHETVR